MKNLYEKMMNRPRETDMESFNKRFVPFIPLENPPYHFDENAAGKCSMVIYNAVKRGEIKKPDKCECCDNKAEVAHHHTYDRPHDVSWVCRLCHKRIHKNIQFLLWLGGWPSRYKPTGAKKTPAPKAEQKTRLYCADDVHWTPPGWTRQQVADDMNDRKEELANLKWLCNLEKLARKMERAAATPNIRS